MLHYIHFWLFNREDKARGTNQLVLLDFYSLFILSIFSYSDSEDASLPENIKGNQTRSDSCQRMSEGKPGAGGLPRLSWLRHVWRCEQLFWHCLLWRRFCRLTGRCVRRSSNKYNKSVGSSYSWCEVLHLLVSAVPSCLLLFACRVNYWFCLK